MYYDATHWLHWTNPSRQPAYSPEPDVVVFCQGSAPCAPFTADPTLAYITNGWLSADPSSLAHGAPGNNSFSSTISKISITKVFATASACPCCIIWRLGHVEYLLPGVVKFRFRLLGAGDNSFGLAFYVDGIKLLPSVDPFLSALPEFGTFSTPSAVPTGRMDELHQLPASCRIRRAHAAVGLPVIAVVPRHTAAAVVLLS